MRVDATTPDLTRARILEWLREEDPTRLEQLWTLADETRRRFVGDAVHLRGLVECSNYCRRNCAYCGLRAAHDSLQRYRMEADEVVACARQARDFGYGTVVLQAGEDSRITGDWMADLIRRLKDETGLAVTLSLGERTNEELAAWRQAGADRYLLRFETSDPELHDAIRPPMGHSRDRFEVLETLQALGYEAGSGVMIGIPGQTWETLARDIELFRELNLDMIGVGPWLPHPDAPLGRGFQPKAIAPEDQVPNTELLAYKVVALTRLVCPDINIPSTTALATLNLERGRELGLQRGANVVMPNLTPLKYRQLYEIYPAKACVRDDAIGFNESLQVRLRSIGRYPGQGPGFRQK